MNEKSKNLKPEFYNLIEQNAAKKNCRNKITKEMQIRASRTKSKNT